jgi:hypothetical protein
MVTLGGLTTEQMTEFGWHFIEVESQKNKNKVYENKGIYEIPDGGNIQKKQRIIVV